MLSLRVLLNLSPSLPARIGCRPSWSECLCKMVHGKQEARAPHAMITLGKSERFFEPFDVHLLLSIGRAAMTLHLAWTR